jgi:hypothetical protein
MKYVFGFIILSLLNYSLIKAQNSFSYFESTLNDERIFDGAEDKYGNFLLVGYKDYTDSELTAAYFLVLDSIGQLIYQQEFTNQEKNSYFASIHIVHDTIYILGAQGSVTDGIMDELLITILDSSFSIIKSRTFNFNGLSIVDIESILNKKKNLTICGNFYMSVTDLDIFLFEVTRAGDSLQYLKFSESGKQMEFDLAEKPDGGYKVFAFGNFPGAPNSPGTILEFDSAFNYLSADSIPYALSFNHSASFLDDSTILITGNKPLQNPIKRDLGIIKTTSGNDLISGNHFGKEGDTTSYVGGCSNLSIISYKSIYFGGVSNIIPEQGLFQEENSWILLNNIDSDLNLNWQQFYGGDAAYYLWGLKATNDGGCLLMATRYDADIQDYELDIYILKVDSSGLLTSTGEGPQIPVQQLSIVPNPAIDAVSIRYPDIFGYDEKEIEIFNSQGMPVIKVSATSDVTEKRIDIARLPTGLYFVVLKVEGKKVATGKLLKI